jgi:hypothetical protein
VLSNLNWVATTFFSRNRKAAHEWARHAHGLWMSEGIELKELSAQRAPGLAKRIGRGSSGSWRPS